MTDFHDMAACLRDHAGLRLDDMRKSVISHVRYTTCYGASRAAAPSTQHRRTCHLHSLAKTNTSKSPVAFSHPSGLQLSWPRADGSWDAQLMCSEWGLPNVVSIKDGLQDSHEMDGSVAGTYP
jgi:hypothetical protein